MGLIKVELDCTKNGIKGTNGTGEPNEKVNPYIYQLVFEGANNTVNINSDDTPDANFKVTSISDIKIVTDEELLSRWKEGDPEVIEVTLFFKATIEFNLDYDLDSDWGGAQHKKVIEETNWTTSVSANTVGLEKSDGSRDDMMSFGGFYDDVKIKLKVL